MAYTPKVILTAEESAAKLAAELAGNLAAASTVKTAANDLHMSLHLSGGRYNPAQMDYLLRLCNAMIGLIDDGDCISQRDSLMDELSCDEDGNPIDEDGELVSARSSFGLHHPDSPSFGGAL